MIKVVFTYKTKHEDLDELMEKFKKSASEEFASTPSNIGIEFSKRMDKEYVYIVLDIYYDSLKDYELRSEFERTNDKWQNIWFNKNNKHEEVSVCIFDILSSVKL